MTTSNVELLSLPEPNGSYTNPYDGDDLENYARANMEPLIAEIEWLRAEVEALKHDVCTYMDSTRAENSAREQAEARAERLAEALREVLIDLERSQANMRNAAKTDPRWEGCADAIQPRVDTARALLREQEAGRG